MDMIKKIIDFICFIKNINKVIIVYGDTDKINKYKQHLLRKGVKNEVSIKEVSDSDSWSYWHYGVGS